MKVVAITGERKCALVEKSDPKAADDFCVVKIHSAPMCTEYKAYKDGIRTDRLGHEAAGEVVETAQPGRVKPGDRVVVMPHYPCGKCSLCLAGEYIHCRSHVDPLPICGCEAGTSTYAEYCLKTDWLLLPIPAGVDYDHAAMACCGLGPTFGAMQSIGVSSFDTVLIAGLGPVGLGGVINGCFRGARVVGVDVNPFRRDLAAKLGAAVTLDADGNALQAVMEATGGTGVDKAIDCSGVPQAQRLMVDALRRRGSCAFVGEGSDLTIRISEDMIRKGITLHGQWHWNLAHAPLMMKMIKETADKLDMLITHTFPMDRAGDALELQLTGECGKVVLHPWD